MTAPLSPLTARFVHRWFPKPDKQNQSRGLVPHP